MTQPEESKEQHEDLHDFTGPLSPGVKKLMTVFGTICTLLVIVDFFIKRKTYAPGEGFPAFYAVYGFAGCVFLVLAAKSLRKLVMREEDYWDPSEGQD